MFSKFFSSKTSSKYAVVITSRAEGRQVVRQDLTKDEATREAAIIGGNLGKRFFSGAEAGHIWIEEQAGAAW